MLLGPNGIKCFYSVKNVLLLSACLTVVVKHLLSKLAFRTFEQE